MPKVVTAPIASFNQATISTINNNFDAVEEAMEKTLSRDGTSPNQMNADFDMNENDIINVDRIDAERADISELYLDGSRVIPGEVSVFDLLINDPTFATATSSNINSASATKAYVDAGAVDSRIALKALNPSVFTSTYLTEEGREGLFIWRSGDYSAEIAADTLEGIYIKADEVAATSGVWVRQYQGPVFVTWWGADPTFTNDSAPAFKAARDFLEIDSQYRGGTIRVPKGRYIVNDELAFTAYLLVHNIYLVGDGEINTTLDFSGAPAGTDGISFGIGAHFGVEALMINGARRHGIFVEDTRYYYLRDLRIQNSLGSGIENIDTFMGLYENIWSTGNANGFRWQGYHTSCAVIRCHGKNSTAGSGFSINGMTYSTFIACGADFNNWGYTLSNMRGVSFIGCGAESSNREGVRVTTSDASAVDIPTAAQNIQGVTFQNFFAFHNSLQSAGTHANFMSLTTANSRNISIVVDACVSVRVGTERPIVANGASGSIFIEERQCSLEAEPLISNTVYWEGRAIAFTPTVIGTTTAGTGTYTTQIGRYVLRDGVCHFEIALVWTAHDGTGNMKISGLPFTSASSFNPPVNIRYSNLTFTTAPIGFVEASSATVFPTQAASGAAASGLAIDTAASFWVAGSYRIA